MFETECPRWTGRYGRAYAGALLVTSASTFADCQAACVANAACNGIEFTATAAINQRCYIHLASSGASRVQSTVNHFELHRHCPGTYKDFSQHT